MPQNNVITGPDGRYRYRYTDSTGQSRELRSRKNEGIRAFKRRCETAEEMARTRLGNDITFGELFSAWQEQYQALNCSPADQRAIADAYRLHVRSRIGHRQLSDITKSDVLPILTEVVKQGYSKSVLSKVRGSISRPYAWAIQVLDMPLTNPVTGLRVTAQTKSTGQVRVITDQEYERLLEAAQSSRYYYLYQVLWHTGLRPSEALGLKLSDIRGSVLQIRRGITRDGLSALKTANAVRDIPITSQLRDILQDAAAAAEPNRAGWLFPGQHGRQPSMRALICAHQRVLKYANGWRRTRKDGYYLAESVEPLELTMYDMRHTFGTRMAEAGMSHKSLQIIMGHSDISVTMKYYVGSTPAAMLAAKQVMEQAGNTDFVPYLSRLGSAIVQESDNSQTQKAQ